MSIDQLSPDERVVLAAMRRIGYGRAMQLAAEEWRELDATAALTVGPTEAELQVSRAIFRLASELLESASALFQNQDYNDFDHKLTAEQLIAVADALECEHHELTYDWLAMHHIGDWMGKQV